MKTCGILKLSELNGDLLWGTYMVYIIRILDIIRTPIVYTIRIPRSDLWILFLVYITSQLRSVGQQPQCI